MKMLWCDFETTGLDAHKDAILETVFAEADFFNPFEVKVIHQSVLWFHPGCVEDLDPHIIEMHTKNGLLKECGHETKSLDAFEVEDALLPQFPEGEEYVLAGSSIGFDWEFIKAHMPRLAKRLSHRKGDVRKYDVSVLKLEAQSQGMPPIPKALAHRALDDIYESIRHAKECREWLAKKK